MLKHGHESTKYASALTAESRSNPFSLTEAQFQIPMTAPRGRWCWSLCHSTG